MISRLTFIKGDGAEIGSYKNFFRVAHFDVYFSKRLLNEIMLSLEIFESGKQINCFT